MLLPSKATDSKEFSDAEKDEKIKTVLYGIGSTMLQLTILTLTNNIDNQVQFRDRWSSRFYFN